MDWIQLFEDNRVHYVTRGPNTRRGEISIHCPWCGPDDPSEHLGISLSAPLWGCHRNATHRGKSPYRLLQGILGCSYGQARLLVQQYDAADPESLDDVIKAFEAPQDDTKQSSIDFHSEWNTNFRPIRNTGATTKFWNYLANRGFENPQKLIDRFDLKCALTGRWKDRILIPISRDNTVIGWTGRAIQKPVNAPRYLSTSDVIKKTVFEFDYLSKGGDILFITEGPFDAMKLAYHVEKHGAYTTCIFGTSVTEDQLMLLRHLSKSYLKTVLLLDVGTVEQTFMLSEWLLNVVYGQLPDGCDDPGELTRAEALDLLKAVQR